MKIISELLSYNKDSGEFTWRKGRSFTAYEGTKAGGITSQGYLRIKILGREYLGHRLAWFFINGKFPKGQIDHINGNRLDNRIENLRTATSMQQRANAKLNKDNSSGYRGVYFNKRAKKWRAHIQREHLGYFNTKEEASAAFNSEFDIRFGSEFRRNTQ